MTELAKTLEVLLAAYRKPGSTSADAFALRSHMVAHADEIVEALHRTGQLVPAQSGDVEAVARAISVAMFGYDCIPCDTELCCASDSRVGTVMRAAQAATAAMTSAKDAEIAEARRQAFEEAAKACEAYRYGDSLSDSCTLRKEHRQDIAKAIRALAERKEAP